MSTRLEDTPNTKPTRVVSWTSVVGIAAALAVPAFSGLALMWKSQIEQNKETQIELKYIGQNMADVKAEVKAQTATLATKSVKDAEQDAKLIDLDRRVTRAESRQ